MKREKGPIKYVLLLALLALILAQDASAYYGRTGISPLDRGIEAISNVFNIRVLRDNPTVQEGFFKFMLFIVLFAVSNYGLNRAFNKDGNNSQAKKTAGIISFAFSMIGIFMMPRQWLDVTGGAITAIMSSCVFLLIFYGGAYAAMSVLKPKDQNDEMGWVKNLLGILLLLFLIVLLGLWADFARIPMT